MKLSSRFETVLLIAVVHAAAKFNVQSVMRKSKVTFQDEIQQKGSTVLAYHGVTLKKSDGELSVVTSEMEIKTVGVSEPAARPVLAQRPGHRLLFSVP